MVAYNFAKVNARVRFSLPAPKQERSSIWYTFGFIKRTKKIIFI